MWEIIGTIVAALALIGGVIYAFARQATQLEEFRKDHAEQIKRFYSELERIDDRIESSDTSYNDMIAGKDKELKEIRNRVR